MAGTTGSGNSVMIAMANLDRIFENTYVPLWRTRMHLEAVRDHAEMLLAELPADDAVKERNYVVPSRQ